MRARTPEAANAPAITTDPSSQAFGTRILWANQPHSGAKAANSNASCHVSAGLEAPSSDATAFSPLKDATTDARLTTRMMRIAWAAATCAPSAPARCACKAISADAPMATESRPAARSRV